MGFTAWNQARKHFQQKLGADESRNKADFWKQNEHKLQKWKIIEYIAAPIQWETRSTVARHCRTQNLTDHWPSDDVRQVATTDCKQLSLERMEARNRRRWVCIREMLMTALDDAENLMCDINIEYIVDDLRMAARAIGSRW